MRLNLFTADQIAPCGMNCGVCSAYLAFSHNLKKARGKIWHCAGCRAREKKCAYLKGACGLLLKAEISFCYECPDFPCKRLQNIDRRYRTTYGTSFIQNLLNIKNHGLAAFLESQTKSFLCRRCRKNAVSVHNKKCFACDTVVNWRA